MYFTTQRNATSKYRWTVKKKNGWKPVGCNSNDKRRQKLAWTNRLTKKKKKERKGTWWRDRQRLSSKNVWRMFFFYYSFGNLELPAQKDIHTHARTSTKHNCSTPMSTAVCVTSKLFHHHDGLCRLTNKKKTHEKKKKKKTRFSYGKEGRRKCLEFFCVIVVA